MLVVLTWGVTLASVVGVVANIYKKHWCFIIWSCSNAFWCGYDFYIGANAQAVLFGVYFVLAVWGLLKWRKGNDAERGLKKIDCLKERERVDWTCPYTECRRTITKKYWESILGFKRRVIKHIKRHRRENAKMEVPERFKGKGQA